MQESKPSSEPIIGGPIEAKPKAKSELKPTIKGYRVSKDVQIATRSGSISIKAHMPITDPRVIEQLKQSKIKLDPIYE